MECPVCQYQMGPFETACPKCARIAKNPPPAPVAPIVVPPAKEKEPISFLYLLFRIGLVMGALFVLLILAIGAYTIYLHQGDAKAKADLEASQAQGAADRAKARADKTNH